MTKTDILNAFRKMLKIIFFPLWMSSLFATDGIIFTTWRFIKWIKLKLEKEKQGLEPVDI